MKLKLSATSKACILFGAAFLGINGSSYAQSNDAGMRQQIDLLQQQIQMLKARLDKSDLAATTAKSAAPVAAPVNTVAEQHDYIERKKGDGMTLLTRGGEITAYGNLDLSIDTTTKGANGKGATAGFVGNGGYMPAVSSNLSYIGLKGSQALPETSARFVWQLETQIDVSAASGTSGSNSNTSNVVKGGLTSRNSFVGLADSAFGAVKIGKTDAPYKTSTAMMNPFSGMLGDYSVIMGNSGGDNRVEFGTRLEHAIWYESPNMHGFTVNALVSPGQNRGYDNSNLAAGGADCTGGNIPGSGATPVACNDGSFGTAYSVSTAYRKDGLLLTGAYELHKNVNRNSDLGSAPAFMYDVANEAAAKIGAQYHFASTGTTVSAIAEKMTRNVDPTLVSQNERQRSGWWLALSQQLTAKDSAHFGWAHANATPGDTGQHNTNGGANPDNSANMFTVAFKHQVDKQFSFYTNYAVTMNRPQAHYDLGAGGRGVTTDCHDASNPDTGFDPNGNGPHCYAGTRLQGVSVGMKYAF